MSECARQYLQTQTASKEKYNQAQKLQTQAIEPEKQSRTKEVVDNELKWRSR